MAGKEFRSCEIATLTDLCHFRATQNREQTHMNLLFHCDLCDTGANVKEPNEHEQKQGDLIEVEV